MARIRMLVALLAMLGVSMVCGQANELPCGSPLFCNGPVLTGIQMSSVFNSSKTFVDMPALLSPEKIEAAFNLLPNTSYYADFVALYFAPPASDLEAWVPTDWVPTPRFIDDIVDVELKAWAVFLNQFWLTLGKQLNQSVLDEPSQHSLLEVENPFIVPGGRFREWYYWDSYWTMKGLLACGLTKTVKGMIQNMISMVETYGFVPNGGRAYYLDRSQPPLLTQMVEQYIEATNDTTFLQEILPVLDAEYQFWMSERTVELAYPNDSVAILNIYNVSVDVPRPESYLNDVETATTAGMTPEQAAVLYGMLATAAETGWDFSSRWLGNQNTLATADTKHIVPVDLNGIMYLNEVTLGGFHDALGDYYAGAQYQDAAANRRDAIEAFLWDEEAGMWLDYNTTAKGHPNRNFYGSTAVPLWAGAYDTLNTTRETVVIDTLVRLGVLDYPGGMPTSLLATGQQWDFPNAWAPLNYFMIEGLASTTDPRGYPLSMQVAQAWITTAYAGYNATGLMYEKYNATAPGAPGHGGEYPVQTGFGWTNGLVLYLLSFLGNVLHA